jgi:hypothetical protein
MAKKSAVGKVLTKEIAEQILANFEGFLGNYSLDSFFFGVHDLSSFEFLTLDAADFLVKNSWLPLNLGGLKSLTADLSAVLSHVQNWLLLPKLTSLSPESAAHFAGKPFNKLVLTSLENLPAKSAEHLVTGQLNTLALNHLPSSMIDALIATHDTWDWNRHPPQLIILSAITLDPRTATALSYLSSLVLNHVHELDESTAYHLSRIKWELCLNGLQQMSVEAARAFGRDEVTLTHLKLNDLRNISDPAATLLFHPRTCSLELNGLTSLSVASAKSIGQGAGILYLNSLRTLSDDAAIGLAKRNGQLFLDGLTDITPVAATALGSQKVNKGDGTLSLNGLTRLSPAVAEGLSKGKHLEINLNGVTELDTQTAKICAKFRTRELNLGGLKHLTPEAALELIGFRGKLHINFSEENNEGMARFSTETQLVLLKHHSL